MGRTLATWQAKVADLILDADNRDLTPAKVEAVGLRPAFAQYAIDRPRALVVEVAGSDSDYFALPAGWAAGLSRLTGVEYPARSTPPSHLDPQSWSMVRSVADAAIEQIRLDRSPSVGEFVRFAFTGAWPFPTASGASDLLDDVAYEAVAALAASLCETSLAAQAARARMGAIPTDFADGRERSRQLIEAAKLHRSIYDRLLGLGAGAGGEDGGRGTSAPPAHGRLDLDPSSGSLFHGGRR